VKGLYVRATQKGYIRTRKAELGEAVSERTLRPSNAKRLYTDEKSKELAE